MDRQDCPECGRSTRKEPVVGRTYWHSCDEHGRFGVTHNAEDRWRQADVEDRRRALDNARKRGAPPRVVAEDFLAERATPPIAASFAERLREGGG
jgi:sugar phosphate isomerase/epimerase